MEVSRRRTPPNKYLTLYQYDRVTNFEAKLGRLKLQ